MNEKKQTTDQLRDLAIGIIEPVSREFVSLQRLFLSADVIELAGKINHDEVGELIGLISRCRSLITSAQSRDISKSAQARRINGW